MKRYLLLLSLASACILPTPAEAAHKATAPLPKYDSRAEKPLRDFKADLDASINSNRETSQLVKHALLKYSDPQSLYNVVVTYCKAYKIDPDRARQIATDTKSRFLNHPKLPTDDALGMSYLFEYVFVIAEENCV